MWLQQHLLPVPQLARPYHVYLVIIINYFLHYYYLSDSSDGYFVVDIDFDSHCFYVDLMLLLVWLLILGCVSSY